jgi:UDP-N-acetylglucosamine 4-epimerase
MNLLLTGGAGFIGSHILEAAINDSRIEKIRVLDNLSSGFVRNIEPF